MSRAVALDMLCVKGLTFQKIKADKDALAEMQYLQDNRSLQIHSVPERLAHSASTISFLTIGTNVTQSRQENPIANAADVACHPILDACDFKLFVETEGCHSPELWESHQRCHLQGTRGVVAIWSSCVTVTAQATTVRSGVEALGLHLSNVTIMYTDVNIICLYRSPRSGTLLDIQEALTRVVDALPATANTIILGDFNEDVYTKHNPLAAYMQARGLQQLVTDATTNRGTLIDHGYSNLSELQVSTHDAYFSYHKLICCTV